MALELVLPLGVDLRIMTMMEYFTLPISPELELHRIQFKYHTSDIQQGIQSVYRKPPPTEQCKYCAYVFTQPLHHKQDMTQGQF